MFTGLVRAVGSVRAIERGPEGARLEIAADLASELDTGDSIAVNGVCLTATAVEDGAFAADAMNRTLELTSLGGLAEGSRVNLEPALRAGEPMGGHIVQGHVDGVGKVTSVSDDGFARRVRIELPRALRRYVVEHGSIALDGVSLTVASLHGGDVEVSLIPETLERTTLGELGEGSRLNVEVDILARHVERLVQGLPDRKDPGA